MNRLCNKSAGTSLFKAAIVAALVIVLTGCTQQLAQRSQNNWLKSIQAQALHKTSVQEAGGPLQGEVTTVLSGYLESTSIGELSGLAASHKNPDVFWAINDSGNRPELFAVDKTGRHLQTFSLPERNIDWEDLASFRHEGKSWLAIADTGDNLRRRSSSFLYLLEEPVLDQPVLQRGFASAATVQPSNSANAKPVAAAAHASRELKVQATIEFAYVDGPQNVESIAVSAEDGSIYLVAKRGAKSSLYELPLVFESQPGQITAKLIGNTTGLHWDASASWIEQSLGSRFLLGPTAMDISADNQLAVIANYRHVYLYRKQPGQAWSAALRSKPQIISSHRMSQSESVAFSAGGDFIIVGSEGIHAPVLLVQ